MQPSQLSNKVLYDILSTVTTDLYYYKSRVNGRSQVAIYNASQVCKQWHTVSSEVISDLAKIALAQVMTNKIQNHGGGLSSRYVKMILSFADFQWMNSGVISRFISQNQSPEACVKAISLAKGKITLQHFKEFLAAQFSSEVLLALFDELKSCQQECLTAIIERNHLDSLTTILQQSNLDIPKEFLLNEAVKKGNKFALDLILQKNPELKTDLSTYQRIFNEETEFANIKDLLHRFPDLTVSEDKLVKSVEDFDVFEILIEHFLTKGNKISLHLLRRFMLFNLSDMFENTAHREKQIELIAKAYVKSNKIVKIEDDLELKSYLDGKNPIFLKKMQDALNYTERDSKIGI